MHRYWLTIDARRNHPIDTIQLLLLTRAMSSGCIPVPIITDEHNGFYYVGIEDTNVWDRFTNDLAQHGIDYSILTAPPEGLELEVGTALNSISLLLDSFFGVSARKGYRWI